MSSSDGLRCEECDRVHEDWERTSESEFERGMHRGVRDELECGYCGGTTTQVRS